MHRLERIRSLLPHDIYKTRRQSYSELTTLASSGPGQGSTIGIKFHSGASSLTLTLANGEDPMELHLAWLRDHCPCSTCIHPIHGQKLHASGQLTESDCQPKKIEIESKAQELHVTWPHHSSRYSIDWLRSFFNTKRSSESIYPWTHGKLKASQTDIHRIGFDAFLTDAGQSSALKSLWKHGLFLIEDAPFQFGHETIRKVAQRLGTIRNTFYGETWDVKNDIRPSNVAYTDVKLGYHMDILYFQNPPGVQLLHCLSNTVAGGESQFIDSLAVLETLKRENPVEYAALSKIPVPYHYRSLDKSHYYYYERPMIQSNERGHQLFYSPPFQGPLAADHDTDTLNAFYRGCHKLEEIFKRPGLEFAFRMSPGQMSVFDNQRILHARKAFDSQCGNRHLVGTYVDLDDIWAKMRARRIII